MNHIHYYGKIRQYAQRYGISIKDAIEQFNTGFKVEQDAIGHTGELTMAISDQIAEKVFDNWDKKREKFMDYYSGLSNVKKGNDEEYSKKYYATARTFGLDVKIYLVNSEELKKEHNSFTEGGHHIAREDLRFIPEGEIYVDNTFRDANLIGILLHEVNEYGRMNKLGEDYETAHENSEEVENNWRNGIPSPLGVTNIMFQHFTKNESVSLPFEVTDIDPEYFKEIHNIYKESPLVSINYMELVPENEDAEEMGRGGNVHDRGNRPSPAESATLYSEGFEMEGQDGNIWRIAVDSRGIHRWQKTNNQTTQKKNMETKEKLHGSVPKALQVFMPNAQTQAVNYGLKGEEAKYFSDKIDEFLATIKKMPRSYETDDIDANDKIVYLRYMDGSSNWLIVEKDTGQSKQEEKTAGLEYGEQYQAYGYAILQNDTINAEWGYIPIVELKAQRMVELDFFWKPMKFKEAMIKLGYWEKDEVSEKPTHEEPKQESEDEEMTVGELIQSIASEIVDETGIMGALDTWKNSDIVKFEKRFREEILKEKIKLPLGEDVYAYLEDENYHAENKLLNFMNFFHGDENFMAMLKRTRDRWKEDYPDKYEVLKSLNGKTGVEVPNTIESIPLINFDPLSYKNAYELNLAIQEYLDTTSEKGILEFTAEEKAFLNLYTGMGGLDKLGATGKGILYEYYTPDAIIEKMWALAYKYGFKPGMRVLEPAAGIGRFCKYLPLESNDPDDVRFEQLKKDPEEAIVKGFSAYTAIEPNKYSARILKILYPFVDVRTGVFEQEFIKNNKSVKSNVEVHKYNLCIGNPPYGKFEGFYAGMGEKAYTQAGNYIEYFIFRGLDTLESGGLLIYIVGAEVATGGLPFLKSGINNCKKSIAEKADLIDAYRMPNGVFDRTDVLTDIIVLRKK